MFLLIDGSNIFLRAIFGTARQGLSTSDGQPTGGVYTFISSLASLTSRFRPTHLLVAWDGGKSAYRLARYPEYKSGRRKTASEGFDEVLETLPQQKEILTRLLDLMGVPQLREEGVEADDIIATLTNRFTGKVVIVSADHDLRQLCRNGVRVLKPSLGGTRRTKEEVFDEKSLRKAYQGLSPARLPEVWAIAGDDSDGLPGVKGVGEKTALKLIVQYGDMRSVLAESTKVDGYQDQILINYDCIQLRGDIAECRLSLEEMEWKPRGMESPELMQLLDRLEMSSIIARLEQGVLWTGSDVELGHRLGEGVVY